MAARQRLDLEVAGLFSSSSKHPLPPTQLDEVYVRSLLAGEALEEDLGVAVDAQVVDRLGVGGRRGAV